MSSGDSIIVEKVESAVPPAYTFQTRPLYEPTPKRPTREPPKSQSAWKKTQPSRPTESNKSNDITSESSRFNLYDSVADNREHFQRGGFYYNAFMELFESEPPDNHHFQFHLMPGKVFSYSKPADEFVLCLGTLSMLCLGTLSMLCLGTLSMLCLGTLSMLCLGTLSMHCLGTLSMLCLGTLSMLCLGTLSMLCLGTLSMLCLGTLSMLCLGTLSALSRYVKYALSRYVKLKYALSRYVKLKYALSRYVKLKYALCKGGRFVI